MSAITARKLRVLFRDEGFRLLEIRSGKHKHWTVTVQRDNGSGRPFNVTVARTPSDFRFLHLFCRSLRRAERAAAQRMERRVA